MASTNRDCAARDPALAAKLVNFVAFQCVWFVVVSTAAERQAWIGIVVAGTWIATHLAFSSRRRLELPTIAIVTATGVAMDQIAVATGIQRFEGGLAIGLVPVWIAALWASFATLLHSSMSWMVGRLVLGAALGAVFGPLAYLGAERLGAIRLGNDPRWLAISGLALEWALVMPVALWVAARRRTA
ncbi:MAG: DUF2878 domain-containing protein [Planctomycetes bacterium]|nr:DUF2878 domain-containing protein [Planctomycetota bacterium]